MSALNLVVSSTSIEHMRLWIDVLEPIYPLTVVDNRHLFSSPKDSKCLLIIDSTLLDQIKRLSQSFAKVIVVSDKLDSAQKVQIIYEGAWGYSEKSIDPQLIKRVIAGIQKDEVWLERQIIPQILKHSAAKNDALNSLFPLSSETKNEIFSNLTQREHEVIKLIYSGENNTSIANRLQISLRTVKAHLTAIYTKLNVQGRYQLIVLLKDIEIKHLSNKTAANQLEKEQ